MVLLAVLCLGICGCESVRDLFRDQQRVAPEEVAKWWKGPRVRAGIALTIQVGTAATPMTSMNCLVDQDGTITLPLLLQKPVYCDGMKLDELKDLLIKEYSVYYRQPQVTVTFAPYDGKGVSPWGTITVMGEVGNQGPVNMPATMDMTVTRALQAAGGCRPFADRSRIRVTRCIDEEGNQARYIVDLNEIGKFGRPDKDMVLRPGDVVWVPETIF